MSKIEGKSEQTLEELINEPSNIGTQDSGIRVESLNSFIDGSLFESVRAKLARKVTATQDHDYVVRFFGVRGSSIEIEKHCNKLAELVNQLCLALNVVGQLGDFIKYDFYFDGTNQKEPESAYLAYLAMTPQAADIVDLLLKAGVNGPWFGLGGVPPTLGDL